MEEILNEISEVPTKKAFKKAKKTEKKLKTIISKPKTIKNKRLRIETIKAEEKIKENDRVEELITARDRSKKYKNQTLTRINSLISSMFVVVLAVFSGLAIGNHFTSGPKTPDYSKYNETELKDNVTEALASAAGKKPTDVSATCAYIVADYNLYNVAAQYIVQSTDNSGISNPYVKGGIQLKKYCYKTIDGKSYVENLSIAGMSMACKAEKIYTEAGSAKIITGSINGSGVPSWNGSERAIDRTLFKNDNGLFPNEVISYIISSKTIVGSENKMVLLPNGNYKASFKIDKVMGVINYAKQVKALSGLGDFPNFDKDVIIEFEMDENFRFLKFSSIDEYSVKVPVLGSAKCSGKLELIYDYDTVPQPR